MKTVLVIGSGAREHALVMKLSESAQVGKIVAAPGNPGIAKLATIFDIKDTDIKALVQLAQQEQVDLVVVGPEVPLVLGLADELRKVGIACFGPNKQCAQLEGSKQFAKEFMVKHAIPTASFHSFDNAEHAQRYVETLSEQTLVIKADGLAQGKGVVITQNRAEAIATIHAMMAENHFGEAGSTVVIEEFLTGEEVSLLTFVDGKHIVPMLPVQDHKRIGEQDTGLNTGGMGTYAPTSVYTTQIAEQVNEQIIAPLEKALQQEDLNYRGCLYVGLMLTEAGPKVIEFNVRFGDPETEALMPLLQSDLYDIMYACAAGRLAPNTIAWHNAYCVCVIIASGGYPEAYNTGYVITDSSTVSSQQPSWVFYAGTSQNQQGQLVTSGGRVMAVAATGETFLEAQQAVYERVKHISFTDSYFRSDIGYRENKRLQNQTINVLISKGDVKN